jgi:hypothetical protein
VLEEVRNSRDAGVLVAAADLEPRVKRNARDVLVRPDDDLQAVRQRLVDDPRRARVGICLRIRRVQKRDRKGDRCDPDP